MKRRARALGEAGFENVATYINSGNAVRARTGLSRKAAHDLVAEVCRREFGFEKDIHLVSKTEWAKLIADNPFPDATEVGKFLHAAVLERQPEPGRIGALRGYADAR